MIILSFSLNELILADGRCALGLVCLLPILVKTEENEL